MASSNAKDALFEAIALMGKAFASPRRLELLDLLAQAPRSVEDLARASGQSTANASQHLQALHAAGMVTREREGTRVVYALAGEEALRLWLALRDASAAQLAEVERAAEDYLGEDVETIGREELLERLASGDVVLVDVRPPRSSPPVTSRAPARSRSTSSSGGWPSCPPTARSSPTAAGRSAPTRTRRCGACGRRGRSARRLEDGWPEWRLAQQAEATNHLPRPTEECRMNTAAKTLDTQELEQRVKGMYQEVALEPEREFHFETGRALAERLGYPPEDLDRIPAAAIDSFAGVGYFLDLAAIAPGETVLDLGSGSGMDSFVAALAAGRDGRVIGVDMTDEQLAKATQPRREAGFGNVEFRARLHRGPARRRGRASTASSRTA